MRRIALLSVSLGAALISLLPGTPAQSQNSRSWVASYGGGTACTRSAPCAKFGDAVAATSVGGEINCVDGADFGPVTITKPLTIDCAGTGGAIGGGVSVTNFAGEIVTLRGLTIQGYEFLANGIYFAGGGELHVANCKISGFAAAPPNEIPVGINFVPPSGATAKL
jgi:hypothetical protein